MERMIDMMAWNMLAQTWILIPVAFLMITGFALTLRSVDVRAGAVGGLRQMASNLTSTVIGLGVCLVVLTFVQSMVGFNLGGR